MKDVTSKTNGVISLIIATIAVSGASIFIRYCESPAVVIAFWRLSFAVLFLIPFCIQSDIRKQFKPYLKQDFFKIFGLAGFFLALHFLFWIQSLKFTTVAISVIVVNSSPIWVIVISFLIFHEKISKFQLIGLLFGFGGLILIALAQNPEQYSDVSNDGFFLALLGAFMVAFYFIIGRRMRSDYLIPNIPYVLFVNLFCSIFLYLFSILLGTNVFEFPLADLIWFIALAVGPSLLGHALYIFAMKYISAQTVSLAVIGETIGASLLGWLLLMEALPPETFIGGFFVVLGIYMNIKYEISKDHNLNDELNIIPL